MTQRPDDKADAPPPGAVRDRVRDHLRRLVRQAALAGATASLGSCGACGPVVCDPLPPPVNCDDPRATWDVVSRSATWARADGGWAVSVSIDFFAEGDLVDPASLTLTGGALAGAPQDGANHLRFQVVPDAGAAQVDFRFGATCKGRATTLTGHLDVSGPPTAGGQVPITVE